MVGEAKGSRAISRASGYTPTALWQDKSEIAAVNVSGIAYDTERSRPVCVHLKRDYLAVSALGAATTLPVGTPTKHPCRKKDYACGDHHKNVHSLSTRRNVWPLLFP